jgi:predicted permease
MTLSAALDTLARDLKHGLRGLRRNPTFTAIALLTIAISIGANTAVFSVVNSVLLKPLQYPESERLVAIWHSAPGAQGLLSVSGELRLSESMYVTYAEQNRTFQNFGIWTEDTATVTGVAEPEQVRAIDVSDGASQALNVAPALGRWLNASDEVPNTQRNLMLMYGYWQRRFGGDPSVIGRVITVDANPWQIVGVMPKGFQFVNKPADLIVPLVINRGNLRLPGFGYVGVGRLKPGVTIKEADADVARLYTVWRDSWKMVEGISPHVYDNWKITPAIRPLKQDVVRSVSGVLWIVMGMIGVVMLIASANVANLLLVRAEARQQELAIRAAVGASPGQIVRTLLAESMLLALMGGALGVFLAAEGLRLLVAIGPGNLPRLNEISLDGRALMFTVAVALSSGVLFGLFPALKAAGPRDVPALRSGGRSQTSSKGWHRARSVLVVAQVALALVLLVSSGLMIRTFQALRSVDPGFTQPDRMQIARVSIPNSLIKDAALVIRAENDIVDKLAAIPGVTSVASASQMPMEGYPVDWDLIVPEGKSMTESQVPPLRVFKRVSPGYFRTQGTKFVAGRDYTWTDLYGKRRYAIVSENLAREFWGSAQAAVGKRFLTVPNAPLQEVIGVVQDVHDNGFQEPAPAIVYWPAYGESIYNAGDSTVERDLTFVIRSPRAGSQSLVAEINGAVWSVSKDLPIASVRTMSEVVSQSLARTSFTLVMLAIAGSMALALGIIGIYGVISYTVSQRRREIGIRVALGAQQSHVRQIFLRYALTMAGIGAAIGLAAAAGLMRLMSSLLFGISPLDPLTYGSVAVILIAAAVLASYLPARRAAAVEPVEALRAD